MKHFFAFWKDLVKENQDSGSLQDEAKELIEKLCRQKRYKQASNIFCMLPERQKDFLSELSEEAVSWIFSFFSPDQLKSANPGIIQAAIYYFKKSGNLKQYARILRSEYQEDTRKVTLNPYLLAKNSRWK